MTDPLVTTIYGSKPRHVRRRVYCTMCEITMRKYNEVCLLQSLYQSCQNCQGTTVDPVPQMDVL